MFALNKCRFTFSDIKLLGHGLSRYGLHTLQEKVQKTTFLAPPKTLHRLLRVFGYYCSFIHQFAKIARPLNDLRKSISTERKPAYNLKAQITWNEDCETRNAFAELKKRLCEAPILAHPRFY